MLLQVAGGGKMQLRSFDSNYIAHVDRWFSVLLPKVAPYLHQRGGPIAMVQVAMLHSKENIENRKVRNRVPEIVMVQVAMLHKKRKSITEK